MSFHNGAIGYITSVLNNYDLFWPKNIGKRVILLDEGDEYLESYIPHNWEVYYHKCIINYHSKKQYSSYISYKYCSPNKYIAFMDSDSIFTMKVTKYMLFDSLNTPYFLYTNVIRHSQFNPLSILKFNSKKWGNGMMTFPVVVYLKHIKELKEYLEKIHNSSIDKIINIYSTSQFCVFLEYTKTFHRKEYNFTVYEDFPLQRCGLHIPYAYQVASLSIKSKNMIYNFNSLIHNITYDGICSILLRIYPQKCRFFNVKGFYRRFYIIDEEKIKYPIHYIKDKNKYSHLAKEIVRTVIAYTYF